MPQKKGIGNLIFIVSHAFGNQGNQGDHDEKNPTQFKMPDMFGSRST